MEALTLEKRQLCDIQGRLFELAFKARYDSPAFIEAFMKSRTAAALDDVYDRLQWAGEEYLLEELNDETGGLPKAGTLFPQEAMYWTGYVYRFWHYRMGESSRDIIAHADAQTMNDCWAGFHTLDVDMAIENLLELEALSQNAGAAQGEPQSPGP